MEKDKLDMLIEEKLKEEFRDVKMSHSLKDSIRKNAARQNNSLYKRFKVFMNRTIEIPIPSAMAVCVIVAFLGFGTFTVTEDMKRDKSIKGYTDVKVMRLAGMDIYMDSNDIGGVKIEKD